MFIRKISIGLFFYVEKFFFKEFFIDEDFCKVDIIRNIFCFVKDGLVF